MTDDQKENYEERAAIMEFDGGLSRAEAEKLALRMFLAICRRKRFTNSLRTCAMAPRRRELLRLAR